MVLSAPHSAAGSRDPGTWSNQEAGRGPEEEEPQGQHPLGDGTENTEPRFQR